MKVHVVLHLTIWMSIKDMYACMYQRLTLYRIDWFLHQTYRWEENQCRLPQTSEMLYRLFVQWKAEDGVNVDITLQCYVSNYLVIIHQLGYLLAF